MAGPCDQARARTNLYCKLIDGGFLQNCVVDSGGVRTAAALGPVAATGKVFTSQPSLLPAPASPCRHTLPLCRALLAPQPFLAGPDQIIEATLGWYTRKNSINFILLPLLRRIFIFKLIETKYECSQPFLQFYKCLVFVAICNSLKCDDAVYVITDPSYLGVMVCGLLLFSCLAKTRNRWRG